MFGRDYGFSYGLGLSLRAGAREPAYRDKFVIASKIALINAILMILMQHPLQILAGL